MFKSIIQLLTARSRRRKAVDEHKRIEYYFLSYRSGHAISLMKQYLEAAGFERSRLIENTPSGRDGLPVGSYIYDGMYDIFVVSHSSERSFELLKGFYKNILILSEDDYRLLGSRREKMHDRFLVAREEFGYRPVKGRPTRFG